MNRKYVSFIVAALMAVAIPVQAGTTVNVTGTFTEVFGPGGVGSAGGTLSATLAGSGWTVTLTDAIHQGVSGNPAPGIYVTDYKVNPSKPAKIDYSRGCSTLKFSNLTLTVTANKNNTPPTFTMTGSATEDSGKIGLVFSGSGKVTAQSGSNPNDIQSGPLSAKIELTVSWPICYTYPAQKITETSALLTGVVVDEGQRPCEYRFVYWADGGSQTATSWKSPAIMGHLLAYTAKGLTPGTLYHSRVEVQNCLGNYPGKIQDFSTTARIAISSTDGGSVVVPGESTFLKPVGTVMPIEAQVDNGWAFVGWTGTAVDAGLVADPMAAVTTVVLKGDTTLKANFKVKIIWVSFHATEAASAGAVTAGFVDAPDKGYTDLLKSADYAVVRYLQTGTPDVNMLNTASLVIVSRAVGSGSFQNAAADTWNTMITVPMINTSGYTLRKSRLGFNTGTTIPDTIGNIKLTTEDPNHPIFEGISMTDGTMDANFAGICVYPDGNTVALGISVNTNPADANGIVLAMMTEASGTVPAGSMIIAEWPAGVVVKHDGGALRNTLAGRRMVFLTGSREASGKNSEGTGMIDLTDDGKKIFLNAVKYMITPPAAPAL